MPDRTDYDNADIRQSCTRKKSYPDEKFAKRVARQMREERDADVVAYGCRHCGRYHIGRAPAMKPGFRQERERWRPGAGEDEEYQ